MSSKTDSEEKHLYLATVGSSPLAANTQRAAELFQEALR